MVLLWGGVSRRDHVEDGLHGLSEIEFGRIDDRDAVGGGEEVDDGAVGGIPAVKCRGDGIGILAGWL